MAGVASGGYPPPIMFTGDTERVASNLRGWLSDVYYRALVDGQADKLAIRLGEKASVDDPAFGHAAGLAELTALIEKQAAWLKEHSADFFRGRFTTGADRDVTEGTLRFELERRKYELPVAIVAERRRSREVDVRLYFDPSLVLGKETPVRALSLAASDPLLPPVVAELIAAINKGDAPRIRTAIEDDIELRDARGVASRAVGAVDVLVAPSKHGWRAVAIGAADDGRVCAVECCWIREGATRAGLLAFERGESGSISAIHLYGEALSGA